MSRRRRRASRPATGGVPQRGGRPDPTSDDVDTEARAAQASAADSDRDDQHARWLREQRPPHWD